MDILFSKYWLLIAAIWYTLNGILHDTFVIIKHKAGYDRELLRLLMDGHVLILSGVVMLVCYLMTLKAAPYGATIAIVIATAMLVYCMMIFPFLKSIGTMAITLAALATSIKLLVTNQ